MSTRPTDGLGDGEFGTCTGSDDALKATVIAAAAALAAAGLAVAGCGGAKPDTAGRST